MAQLFQGYKIAVLDATAVLKPVTPALKEALQAVAVYVPDSFHNEAWQYGQMLPAHQQPVYLENTRIFYTEIQQHSLKMESMKEKGQGLQDDTWGLVTLLTRLKARFVLVTANEIQMQRVMLRNLPVTLYDMNQNRLVTPDRFRELGARYALHPGSTPGPARTQPNLDTGSAVYLRGGAMLSLDSRLRSGLEGTIYHLRGRDREVAKIFRPDMLSQEKAAHIDNICGMSERLGISWAQFPCEPLYEDRACQTLVGFSEPFVHAGKNLDETPLYLGNIDLPGSDLNVRQSYTIGLCVSIVGQVLFLARNGFLVSDFNLGNFSIPDGRRAGVQMWDTDSFGYGPFFSGLCAGFRTSRTYDVSGKAGAIEYCIEALYLFIYSLIALGDPPISERTGTFKPDNPNYAARYRCVLFPRPLLQHFSEVFRGYKDPSGEALLSCLIQVSQSLRRRPETDHTYQELLAPYLHRHRPGP